MTAKCKMSACQNPKVREHCNEKHCVCSWVTCKVYTKETETLVLITLQVSCAATTGMGGVRNVSAF